MTVGSCTLMMMMKRIRAQKDIESYGVELGTLCICIGRCFSNCCGNLVRKLAYWRF